MLIGHKRIWDFLLQSAANNRLAHAYLFVGAPQVGKKKLAQDLAKVLQCENSKGDKFSACGKCGNCVLIEKGRHPDVLILSSSTEKVSLKEEGNMLSSDVSSSKDKNSDDKKNRSHEIRIEQIRELQHQIVLSPFSASQKIVIIDDAEQMNQEAANCLLKTLEEPPQRSLLILVSSNWQRLLPTIVSRCQTLRFLPVKRELIASGLGSIYSKDKNRIEQAVRLSCGRPGAAIELMEKRDFFGEKKELAQEFEKLLKKDLPEKFKYAQKLSQDIPLAQETLSDWVMRLRDGMFENLGANDLQVFGGQSSLGYPMAKICGMIKNILAAQSLLGESGFNGRLILENLMLKI